MRLIVSCKFLLGTVKSRQTARSLNASVQKQPVTSSFPLETNSKKTAKTLANRHLPTKRKVVRWIFWRVGEIYPTLPPKINMSGEKGPFLKRTCFIFQPPFFRSELLVLGVLVPLLVGSSHVVSG